MQRLCRGGAACTEDNVLGRKPSIVLLKKLVEDSGSSSERYEGKHKRSKERSDKICLNLSFSWLPAQRGRRSSCSGLLLDMGLIYQVME